jgi:hypothetical protein
MNNGVKKTIYVQGRKLNPEKRVVAIESTKLMLKPFLSANAFIFL